MELVSNKASGRCLSTANASFSILLVAQHLEEIRGKCDFLHHWFSLAPLTCRDTVYCTPPASEPSVNLYCSFSLFFMVSFWFLLEINRWWFCQVLTKVPWMKVLCWWPFRYLERVLAWMCYFSCTYLFFVLSFGWVSLWLFLSIFLHSSQFLQYTSFSSPSSFRIFFSGALWTRKNFRNNKWSYLPFLHLIFSFFFLFAELEWMIFHSLFTHRSYLFENRENLEKQIFLIVARGR